MIYQEDRPTALSVKENFDSIYINNFSRLFLFAKEYVLFDEEAENIVQDIFLMLWEKREALRVDVSLTAYLFTLVKNKCIDFLRHQMVEQMYSENVKHEYNEELNVKLFALESFDHNFSSEEDIETLLRNAIDKLPERCRLIFIKSRIEGKKYKEIAEELNLSVNTVEGQISIALKKLREELKDYLPLLLFLFIC
ncbi:MAG: RNA polymerase sigma-70 factor [Parabacteroides sp.]|jgi:RNA polymerase sigma-70 factor (family 1)|uniref:ECF RNA polymerase sigma factor SigW n=1 Tax=bioreactor metagenome TaxID=1076179 RepID=A0A644WBF4_9ZZZZ|nr:RNA polymerase sigma-70 factor [Parabacteroides sp.]HAD02586.1 RNA polymerase sigma-70 factor [Porphyromonadaceae bacterium]HML72696.1 RNA polymerase sigma-70 factor [Macellibacteroides fermentans]MDD3509265.1 RNA polymerase sigma-70 factor [Parabacteroides sp.]HNP91584.1 RNA polymerase sigma-70 factor [Macellibacteroides fermentans]